MEIGTLRAIMPLHHTAPRGGLQAIDKQLPVSYYLGMSTFAATCRSILTVREAAAIAGVTPASVKLWCAAARFACQLKGRIWLIDRAQFVAWQAIPRKPGPVPS